MKILHTFLWPSLLVLGACASAPRATPSTPAAPPPAPAPSSGTTLRVVKLKHAQAVELAHLLKGTLRHVRVVADERTNSLVVAYEDERDFAQIERSIAQLDVEVAAAGR